MYSSPFHSNSIPFPYLTLLCSGGHCLLALVHSAKEFSVLGKNLDKSPGDALDKFSRMMRLDLHPEVGGLSGGAAIEKLAERGSSKGIQLMKNNNIIMGER